MDNMLNIGGCTGFKDVSRSLYVYVPEVLIRNIRFVLSGCEVVGNLAAARRLGEPLRGRLRESVRYEFPLVASSRFAPFRAGY